MIKVLDTARMQACDRAAIEKYRIPGVVLMENAGLQVLDAIVEHFKGQLPLSAAVLCGKGNNGGDGFVVARHLHNLGHEVVVYLFGDADALVGDAARNHQMAAAIGVPIVAVTEAQAWTDLAAGLSRFDCVVDAMLGTGLQSAARGVIADAIGAVNASGVPVVAVDLPSGLAADTGALVGDAIVADLTVTFAAPKCCHLLAPASERCGDLTVGDISIPAAVMEAVEPALWLLEPEDCVALLEPRQPDAHKGSYGRVLVLAGSPGTAGAAVLAAQGALRGGAGLVHVACPESVYSLIGAQLTEALVHSVPADAAGGVGTAASGAIERLLQMTDVMALGPGLGTSEETVALVRELAARAECPAVIDADGLNALVGELQSLNGAPGARILTPHPGEAARLLGRSSESIQADRPAAVRELSERTGAVVVLKGHRTLTCPPGGVPIVNPTGNPGMATGGTGDVLTGLIAALLAQGLEPLVAAWSGVYLHSLAGDEAAAQVGEISLLAGDVIEALPAAFAQALHGEAA